MDRRAQFSLQICALGRVIITAISAYISVLKTIRRRRRQMLQAYAARLTFPPPRPPRASPYIWEEKRSKKFWEVTVQRHFTESLWLKEFRLSRESFYELCDIIGPFVGPQDLCRRPPVPTEKRIAIALYKLGSCAEYRIVARTFGVSKTTVHRCVYATCRAIKSVMMHQYIKLPDAQEAQEIAARNYSLHHFPQVYGALDGTHIPILPPAEGYLLFY